MLNLCLLICVIIEMSLLTWAENHKLYLAKKKIHKLTVFLVFERQSRTL